jgi:hypothetical protein
MTNVQTVQAVYEAFGRGDVPAILDHLADDVAWDQDAAAYGVPINEPGTGKAHALRFSRRWATSRSPGSSRRTSWPAAVAVPIRIALTVKATGNVAETLETTSGRSATMGVCAGSSTASTATHSCWRTNSDAGSPPRRHGDDQPRR